MLSLIKGRPWHIGEPVSSHRTAKRLRLLYKMFVCFYIKNEIKRSLKFLKQSKCSAHFASVIFRSLECHNAAPHPTRIHLLHSSFCDEYINLRPLHKFPGFITSASSHTVKVGTPVVMVLMSQIETEREGEEGDENNS